MRQKLLIQLKPFEIVEKYKQILEGLAQYYYRNLTFKSQISKLHYYLIYSCYHTLASRLKKSIAQIIKIYGPELEMEYETEFRSLRTNQITKKKNKIKILKYQDFMKQTMVRSSPFLGYDKKGSIKLLPISTDDIISPEQELEDSLSMKINLRTPFKLKKHCPICGDSGSKHNPIQVHHLNSIKKGKEIGFLKEIMRQLNSKTITCCAKCHLKIHQGKYDGISLSEFVNPALALF